MDLLSMFREVFMAAPSRQGQAGGGRTRLPPGQYLTEKFPVLTYGSTPRVDTETWTFEITGLVQNPVRLTWDQFLAMAEAKVTADFHCVTGWSRFDNRWEGVLVRDLLALAMPKPEARYVMAHCYGGYTTNMPLDSLLADDELIAHKHDGEPLHPDHGGPARLVVPSRYGYKSAKWIRGLEIMKEDERGFWELHGYHSNADPWPEQRYSF
jgi:DMSO/TMAO reductase YedYZ molybdopterin-dependent catalytic subunit